MSEVWKWVRKEFVVVLVIALYAWAFVISPDQAGEALARSLSTMLSISLIIVSVFSALGLFAVLVDKQAFGRRLSKHDGVGMLLVAAGFGTMLIGPVYAIFPLLKTFKDHGVRWGVLVAVMTAWAVKIPMIPLEVEFLGWEFSLLRSVLTVIAAVGMGLLFDKVMPSERSTHE